MDVLIRGNRIAEIEKANSEHWNGVTVLDGSGKFLIPGLWDMEVHLSWTTASALPLLVANGVTNVRDMGSDLIQIERWRTLVSAGLLVGPNILRVGPMLNGESFNQYQMVLGTTRASQRRSSYPEVHRDRWAGVRAPSFERLVLRSHERSPT